MCGEHFKFHKVVQRHYSGEVENVYMSLQKICSGNYVLNFIGIVGVFTALHVMQTRSSDENSVRPSVRPSHA